MKTHTQFNLASLVGQGIEDKPHKVNNDPFIYLIELEVVLSFPRISTKSINSFIIDLSVAD